MRNLTLPLDLLKKMVEWGRSHRDVASILFVEGDSHYVMDRSEEYALFMHKHLLDPDPIEVKGGYATADPPIPTKVNMMRVICHPDKMDIVKPQVADCVAGSAAYAQSLPTTKLGVKGKNSDRAKDFVNLTNEDATNGAPGIATRSKKLLGAPGLTTRSKTLFCSLSP